MCRGGVERKRVTVGGKRNSQNIQTTKKGGGWGVKKKKKLFFLMYNVKKPRPKQEYVFRISSFRLIRISYMYTISILLCLEFFFLQLLHFL
jgi:hypothetical protein